MGGDRRSGRVGPGPCSIGSAGCGGRGPGALGRRDAPRAHPGVCDSEPVPSGIHAGLRSLLGERSDPRAAFPRRTLCGRRNSRLGSLGIVLGGSAGEATLGRAHRASRDHEIQGPFPRGASVNIALGVSVAVGLQLVSFEAKSPEQALPFPPRRRGLQPLRHWCLGRGGSGAPPP